MAMEIIVSAEVHNFGLPESSTSVIPAAPPLPVSFCKLLQAASVELQSDTDSGTGDSMMFVIPGQDLSDSEFTEEFSSAPPSRRGSAGTIPLPPPPPPLPSYLSTSAPTSPITTLPNRSALLTRRSSITIEPQTPSRFRPLIFDDEEYYYEDDIIGDVYHNSYREPKTTENKGEMVTLTCIVCYDEVSDFSTNVRKCCNAYVCDSCMRAIVQTNINEGTSFITCPNPDCDQGAIGKEEILSLISDEMRNKFERLRAEAEGSNTKRACPNCTYLTDHQLPKRFRKYKEEDVQITCSKCQYVWCFACHAPWHKDVSCKQFRRGNVHFKKWTSERSTKGVANCQKCPLCRVYIQRSTGCDHMTCNRCDTHFCYKCGGRFLDLPGIGDHYQQTSILGCEYNYSKNNSIKRKTVRGSYFGAKMAALTAYPVLFIAGVVVVVVVGAVALPIYGGYRYHKYRKNMKQRYWRRRKL
ncbi:E3 ubiquitin-protein ligase RNF217-like [Halichondria panicea]|uniref:E3 ubiquitin-protein ligase RNF217-like n=1 Tax=Halichondria panicea TaxID=6063 RepID=UPI00312B9BC7